jgi:hypothetical protein
MSVFDDRYFATIGPQGPGNPPAPVPAAPASSSKLPFPAADPPIWLLPDGSVSYSGRSPSASTGAASTSQVPGGFLNSNASTLMALGAGIAQGGIGRGLEYAANAAQAAHKQQAQQQSLLHTYDALTDAGVPRTLARAAVYDPHIMRAVASTYFGPKANSTAPAAAAPPADAATLATPDAPAQPPALPDGSN